MNTSVHQIKYSYLFFVLFFLHFDVFSRDNKNWEDQMYEDLLQIYQNNSDPYAITGEYFFKQEHDKTKVFTEGTKNKVNEILIKMDSLKRKTIIYVACGYMVRKTNNLQDKMTSQETQALVDQKSGRIDTVFARLKKKGIEISNINLHISLIVLIKNPNNKNDKKWDFEVNIDRFIPRSDMDNNCAKGVETEIGNANNEKKVGKVMSLSPNLAVIWRANLLVEKMKSCGTVPVHTGDGNKDILAILAHIKDKAAKKQNLIIHATEDHKPVISEINGTNLTIGKTKYERIRYKSFAKVDPSFSDPLVFKLEINNNADPKYAAFIFTKKDSSDKMLFTITIFDSKNEEKKDSLKKYLFGDLDFILNDVK